MNIHYWVMRLKAFTLFKILAKTRKGTVKRLTYLESGKSVEYLLKMLQKGRMVNFTCHKIAPRPGVAGPVLHLSEVRNDNGEIITMEIFRHICEIRKQIAGSLMSLHKGAIASLGVTSMDMVQAWLGLKIADEINPAVYLAHYGHWKYYDSGLPDRNTNILVMPKSSWSKILAESIQKKRLVDQVVIEKDGTGVLKSWILAGLYLVRSLFFSVSKVQNSKDEDLENRRKKKLKTMINYSLGADNELRNDIPYIHATDFDLSRLLYFVRYPNHLPTQPEIQWFMDNGIRYFADPKISRTVPGVPKWQGTVIRNRRVAHFSRMYLRIGVRLILSRKKYSRALLHRLWEMGMKMARWQDFFLSNGVGIVIHSTPSANNFIVNLALSEIGGIAVDVENSIPFDSATYLSNSPCHIRFVSGPYSISQMENPSFSRHILQCGPVNIFREAGNSKNADRLKKKDKTVLTVFDEVPSDLFFGNSIEELYRSICELVTNDKRFFVLIKTKKSRVFEKIQNAKKNLERLVSEEKCVMLDWRQRADEACAFADLTVSLPSTAAFESVASGTPTIVYNPMRSGSSLFYSNAGLNRRIFEETGTMIAAIKRFADRGDIKIGDFRDLLPKIDPFQDGMASKRVGEYLIKCLEGFDLGMSRDDILNNANEDYAVKWGKENVIGS
jgi:hypothetical protein